MRALLHLFSTFLLASTGLAAPQASTTCSYTTKLDGLHFPENCGTFGTLGIPHVALLGTSNASVGFLYFQDVFFFAYDHLGYDDLC